MIRHRSLKSGIARNAANYFNRYSCKNITLA
jgi:hypothetical protein